MKAGMHGGKGAGDWARGAPSPPARHGSNKTGPVLCSKKGAGDQKAGGSVVHARGAGRSDRIGGMCIHSRRRTGRRTHSGQETGRTAYCFLRAF